MAMIMIVDDTDVMRQTVARVLEGAGYQTICAADGSEALAMLNLARPDVVLMDLMMPGMDGLHCLQEMRRDPRGKSTPIIMMTAYDDENRARARELGARDYLIKTSLSINELLERIGRCLEKTALTALPPGGLPSDIFPGDSKASAS
jgi:CheY-like chemotaxis protein